MRFRAHTIPIVLNILVVLLAGNTTHPAIAQEEAECNTWKTAAQTILDDYNQIDESDVVNSVTILDRLRQQLESPLPEATSTHAALLNMLYLKTMSLAATASGDDALNNLAVSWASEAQTQREIAIRLVNKLCTPAPILTIADFSTCDRNNNLGGNMGNADNPPSNTISISYLLDDPNHECVVRLEYEMADWTAYWVKLNGTDFSPYSKLAFDIKADTPPPQQIKLEFRRAENSEWVAVYIGEISDQWQTFEVDFSSFAPVSWAEDLSTLENMETLSFVFEHNSSGESGVIYLDNIAVK